MGNKTVGNKYDLARSILATEIAYREEDISKILDEFHKTDDLCDDCKRDYERLTDEIAELRETLADLKAGE